MNHTRILVAGFAAAATLGLAACDVRKTQEGSITAPKFEVTKTQEGNITVPKYNVDAPDVKVTTVDKEVTVPKITTEKETITLPKVEVIPAGQKDETAKK